jgi:regulatory protein
MTAKRLENIALFYLQRFSTTAAHLRHVLWRRCERALRTEGGNAERRAEMSAWIEDVVARLVRSGAVNDLAYAEGRTAMLRRLGRSPGKIRAALAAKGIPSDVIARVLADTAEAADGGDAAFQAALGYARRRRIGPFRAVRDPVSDRRDLGALARAGFDASTARKVIALHSEEP